MNILVCCEESQAVCKAFRKKGHNAWSCDIQPCSGGHLEWHIQGDVIPLINGDCEFFTMDGRQHSQKGSWDMLICHPPCTYLTAAGAAILYSKNGTNTEQLLQGKIAAQFFMTLYNANCGRIVIENPVPMTVFALPRYNQIIQPYMFGDPFYKRTCLWLKGVSPLFATDIVVPTTHWVHSRKRPEEIIKGQRSPKMRSKTFPGIAAAMANQWG